MDVGSLAAFHPSKNTVIIRIHLDISHLCTVTLVSIHYEQHYTTANDQHHHNLQADGETQIVTVKVNNLTSILSGADKLWACISDPLKGTGCLFMFVIKAELQLVQIL